MPNEDDFVTATVVEGDFDMMSIIEAVKSVPVSSVIASFNFVEGHSYDIISPRPLTNFIEEASGIRLHEFWTNSTDVFFDLYKPKYLRASRDARASQEMSDYHYQLIENISHHVSAFRNVI